jgi:hypothetical protein
MIKIWEVQGLTWIGERHILEVIDTLKSQEDILQECIQEIEIVTQHHRSQVVKAMDLMILMEAIEIEIEIDTVQ